VLAWNALNPRVTFHFTPTSASWLNQVEGFFSHPYPTVAPTHELPDAGSAQEHLRAFLASWNANPTPFVWTKTAHTIVRDHRKMLARISREEH